MMDEMNDVHEFMAKFGNDFEIKWGLAVDQELGKKVKVTILATGFGIENVDGMNNRMKDPTRKAEEEAQAAEREVRRDRYYGNDKSNQQKSRPQIFYFKPEDLDNEDVILAVETTPTYRRSLKVLKDIMNISSGVDSSASNQASENEQGGGSNKIVF